MAKTEIILKVKFIIEKSHLGIHGGLLFNGIPTAYLRSNLVTLFGDTVICEYYYDRLRYGVLYGKPGTASYSNTTATVECTPEEAVSIVEKYLQENTFCYRGLTTQRWIEADIAQHEWKIVEDNGAFPKPERLCESKKFDIIPL
jgi:hypothetical protein